MADATGNAQAPWGMETPPGFEIPLFRAALHPRLLLGVPQDFTFVTGGLFLLAFFFKIWPLYPLAVLLHLGGIWATRQDPQWCVKVWRVAWEYVRYYKP